MKIETTNLDLIKEVCLETEELSIITWKSYVATHEKPPKAKWDLFFYHKLPRLYYYDHSFAILLKDELSLNCLKIIHNQNKDAQKSFYENLTNALTAFIDPALYCFGRCLRWMTRESLAISLQADLMKFNLLDEDTNLFRYLCLSYKNDIQSPYYNRYAIGIGDLDTLENAIRILKRWKKEILSALTLLEFEHVQPNEATPDIADEGNDSIPQNNTAPEQEQLDQEFDDQESVSKELNVKLQWNETNDSLYHLFAQLSLTRSDKPLLGNTIESLAIFLANNVEGMPSINTIKRRINEFRNPDSEIPQRFRIELNITK